MLRHLCLCLPGHPAAVLSGLAASTLPSLTPDLILDGTTCSVKCCWKLLMDVEAAAALICLSDCYLWVVLRRLYSGRCVEVQRPQRDLWQKQECQIQVKAFLRNMCPISRRGPSGAARLPRPPGLFLETSGLNESHNSVVMNATKLSSFSRSGQTLPALYRQRRTSPACSTPRMVTTRAQARAYTSHLSVALAPVEPYPGNVVKPNHVLCDEYVPINIL